jgi:hypothetical protein
MTVSKKLPNMQKKVAVLCLKVPFRNFHGKTEENTKTSTRRTAGVRDEV